MKARIPATWSSAGKTCPSRAVAMSLTPMTTWLPASITAGRSRGVPTLISVSTWLAPVAATVSGRRERGQTGRGGIVPVPVTCDRDGSRAGASGFAETVEAVEEPRLGLGGRPGLRQGQDRIGQ